MPLGWCTYAHMHAMARSTQSITGHTMHRRLTQTESDNTNEQQSCNLRHEYARGGITFALQQMGKRPQGHMPHDTEAKLLQTDWLRHPSTHAATTSVQHHNLHTRTSSK